MQKDSDMQNIGMWQTQLSQNEIYRVKPYSNYQNPGKPLMGEKLRRKKEIGRKEKKRRR
jgi:hypothetical protein